MMAALGACKKAEQAPAEPTKDAKAEAAAPALRGVDMATKTITIGTLNDESGPAAVIGKPFGRQAHPCRAGQCRR